MKDLNDSKGLKGLYIGSEDIPGGEIFERLEIFERIERFERYKMGGVSKPFKLRNV